MARGTRGRVLVCAATNAERAACARGIASAALDEDAFATLLTGWGDAQASRSLGDHLAHGPRPQLVVSSGFAGALGSDLPVGTWVTAKRLFALEGRARVEVDAALRCAGAPAVACTMISAKELVLASQSDTANDPKGEAVDMESAALARVAAMHGVPFMVLRLISDSPERPLPEFLSPFTAAMVATSTRGKLANAARGVRGALGDLGGVARLVRDGSAWTRELSNGWSRFAPELPEQIPVG